MIKKVFCCVVACGCLLCGGCQFAADTYGTEHCHFRLIEDIDNKNEGLYVHEETGVMYFMNTYGGSAGFTAMIKADGTAYTLEDFMKDKKGE